MSKVAIVSQQYVAKILEAAEIAGVETIVIENLPDSQLEARLNELECTHVVAQRRAVSNGNEHAWLDEWASEKGINLIVVGSNLFGTYLEGPIVGFDNCNWPVEILAEMLKSDCSAQRLRESIATQKHSLTRLREGMEARIKAEEACLNGLEARLERIENRPSGYLK